MSEAAHQPKVSVATPSSFESPDTRTQTDMFDVSAVKLSDKVTVAKLVLKPGWVWSKHVKPLMPAGTEWCPKSHTGFLVQGSLANKMKDGTVTTIKAGEAYVIDPGHDGWVVGDQEVIGYEFDAQTAKDYSSLKKDNKSFELPTPVPDVKPTVSIASPSSFESPDTRTKTDMFNVSAVKLSDKVTVAKLVLKPGWVWTKHVKHLMPAGTEWCPKSHTGILVQGSLANKMKDGTVTTIKAGEAYVIDPGHDGWVVGDQEVIGYEFDVQTAKFYSSLECDEACKCLNTPNTVSDVKPTVSVDKLSTAAGSPVELRRI